MSLEAGFSVPTRTWFEATFDTATPVQQRGWQEIHAGHHALLVAPTGSGKTLAAFLAAIDACVNLPADAVEGVYMAASIHDIGKISVPAEILCKPGKLMPLEYELIKHHVQAGYDILKKIEFPWPLAEFIYQLHERMDGSG